MNNKNKIFIGFSIGIMFIIIFSILFLLNYFLLYNKENSYQGYVSAYYYPDTNIEKIYNISEQENISIEKIDNISIANEQFIEVKYYADTYKGGEKVKMKLEKYNEIAFIELYDDL